MQMNYKLFGKSGLRVSELCLGTMTFGEQWGWGSSNEESRRIFDAFVNAGGNFIDTADLYTDGHSEELVGEFIKGRREQFVVATKYTNGKATGNPNAAGNHRKRMHEALNASLRRLNTDYIDVYWVHAWDAFTPVEELMRGLDDIVRAGKVLYVGVSDFPAWVISRANMLAELKGWTPFTGMQMEYNLVERTPERELLPATRELDLAFLAWSPLAGGILSGKYSKKASEQKQSKTSGVQAQRRMDVFWSDLVNERSLGIADRVVEIAREIGRSPAQVALNWLIQRDRRVIPIVGARKLSQFEDNLKCLEFRLDDKQMQRLDELSSIELGFPHDVLQRKEVRDFNYAGMFDRIQSPRKKLYISSSRHLPPEHPTKETAA